MTNELNNTAPSRPDFSAILWRIAWPFSVFSLVLTVLLTASWSLLLPRYTRIDVGGTLRSADEIRGYREQLLSQISAKEEQRRQSVLAIHDENYDALKEKRRQRMSLDELKAALVAHAKAVTEKEDVILYSAFEYDPNGKMLVIRGDVRNSGTRSMTVLAEFSQSLGDLPFVLSTTTPDFAREEDASGFRSPFTITLSLR